MQSSSTTFTVDIKHAKQAQAIQGLLNLSQDASYDFRSECASHSCNSPTVASGAPLAGGHREHNVPSMSDKCEFTKLQRVNVLLLHCFMQQHNLQTYKQVMDNHHNDYVDYALYHIGRVAQRSEVL